jgi:AraC family ethanolamine operon transcriptional activator
MGLDGPVIGRQHRPEVDSRLTQTLVWQRQDLTDAAEQAAAQPWVDMRCDQVGPGDRVGAIEQVEIGPLRVIRETQTADVHKSAVLRAGLCSVSFVEDPDPRSAFSKHRQDSARLRYSQYRQDSTKHLFFLPCGREVDVNVPAGFRSVYATFDQDVLLERARHLNPRLWERAPDDLMSLHTRRLRILATLLSDVLEPGAPGLRPGVRVDPQRMAHALIDAAAFALSGTSLPEATEPPRGETSLRSVRTVMAARAFVDACHAVGDLPTVVDLCAQAGVSQRALQYAFQEMLGLTPLAYLRAARLNQVRTELNRPNRPDLTVTDVAMRWGFFHLGRFAREYQALFLERPSQTLARAMGTAQDAPT